MPICYLGIGSNLGNRKNNIKLALQKINRLKETRVIKASRIIETEPIGGPANQGKFLNACLEVKTNLTPLALLNKLKKIEAQLGRPIKHSRFGPRTIDLDILFYGDRIINKKELKIPHPRILKRKFVLEPLLEIL